MQFLPFIGSNASVAPGASERERAFNQNVWDSQRAVTGEGIENPFEIFRQRSGYIDRRQSGTSLEPWEFGYIEPEPEPDRQSWMPGWLRGLTGDIPNSDELDQFGEIYRQGQGSVGGSVNIGPGRTGPFGVEWGSFFLRAVYVTLGIILLGIGAAALARQSNPVTQTLRQAQRLVS